MTDAVPSMPTRPTDPAAANATTARSALAGVVPPLVTPLSPDGEVDATSLARLVGHQLDAGVHGVFVLGTSGEGTFLTDDQRRLVLDTVVGAVAGQVPVLAGVIDTSTGRSGQHLTDAQKARVDAVVVTAPFYAATHPAEMDRHFRRLAALAGDLPVYAYEIPSRVNGSVLPTDLVTALAVDGVLAGIKDSSGNDAALRRRVLARADAGLSRFAILTGSEVTVDSALGFGVDGVVPGLGNVDPAGYLRLFSAARAGDWQAARSEQDRLIRLFEITAVADRSRMGASSAALGAFKMALHLLGVIDCPATAFPSIPLDGGEREGIRRLLMTAGML